MGMFDEVRVYYRLPGDPPKFFTNPGHCFQTKDLDCTLEVYDLTETGLLKCNDKVMEDFTGTVELYDSNMCGGWGEITYTRNGEDAVSVTYQVIFHSGKLISIVKTESSHGPGITPRFVISKPPTEEEKERWKNITEESLVGKTLYYRHGYPREVLAVPVIAEGEFEWIVKMPNGHLESIDRRMRNHSIFNTLEDAKGIEQNREEEHAGELARWNFYKAEWEKNRGLSAM